MPSEYCSMKEICDDFDLSEQELRTMVADGRVREYRDAGKVFFKRSEVEKIAAKQGSSIVDLEATIEPEEAPPSYDSALSSLADSSSSLGLADFGTGETDAGSPGSSPMELVEPGSGSSLGLSPTEMQAEDFPQELPAAPKPADEPADLTAELSSEIDLLPSGEESSAPRPPSAVAPPDLSLSSSSVISLQGTEDEAPAPKPRPAAAEPAKPAKSGISVFDDDDVGIAADPMGETRISAGVEELEAVGGGSGLLDLTQVNDDTSLGAELLDVISPTESGETQTDTETEVQSAAETMDSGSEDAMTIVEASPAGATETAAAVAVVAPRAAARVATDMRGTVPMNITLILGMLCLALVGLATAAQLQGVWPGFLNMIAKDVVHWSVFGGLALAAIVTGILAILADRG